MRLGRGFTAVARQVPRLAGLAGLCPAHLTARYARRALGGHAAWPGFYRRGTTGATSRRSGRALPCTHFCAHSAQVARGHAAWPGFYRRGTTGATARRSGRALPCAPHCAHSAQRRSGTCGLVGVLPPWHNERHGSPVWQGFALRPSLRAMRAGHSGDMRLGRGFTAVAQRVPRLAGLVEQNCRLASKCRRFPAKIALFVKTLPHFPVLMRLIRGAIVDFRQAFHQNRGFCS